MDSVSLLIYCFIRELWRGFLWLIIYCVHCFGLLYNQWNKNTENVFGSQWSCLWWLGNYNYGTKKSLLQRTQKYMYMCHLKIYKTYETNQCGNVHVPFCMLYTYLCKGVPRDQYIYIGMLWLNSTLSNRNLCHIYIYTQE